MIKRQGIATHCLIWSQLDIQSSFINILFSDIIELITKAKPQSQNNQSCLNVSSFIFMRNTQIFQHQSSFINQLCQQLNKIHFLIQISKTTTYYATLCPQQGSIHDANIAGAHQTQKIKIMIVVMMKVKTVMSTILFFSYSCLSNYK